MHISAEGVPAAICMGECLRIREFPLLNPKAPSKTPEGDRKLWVGLSLSFPLPLWVRWVSIKIKLSFMLHRIVCFLLNWIYGLSITPVNRVKKHKDSNFGLRIQGVGLTRENREGKRTSLHKVLGTRTILSCTLGPADPVSWRHRRLKRLSTKCFNQCWKAEGTRWVQFPENQLRSI